MTPEELAEIKARAEAATPGPWEFADWNYGASAPGFGLILPLEERTNRSLNISIGYGQEKDAEFIAHARTDIPALVAEVEAMYAERRFMKGALADCSSAIERRDKEVERLTAAYDTLRADLLAAQLESHDYDALYKRVAELLDG